MHGRVLAEGGSLADSEAHGHVQEDHDGHGDDEEQQGGELEQEWGRGLNGAEG